MLATIQYRTPSGEVYVLDINGGKITIRRATEKPYEAKPIEAADKMRLLEGINKTLPFGGEW